MKNMIATVAIAMLVSPAFAETHAKEKTAPAKPAAAAATTAATTETKEAHDTTHKATPCKKGDKECEEAAAKAKH